MNFRFRRRRSREQAGAEPGPHAYVTETLRDPGPATTADPAKQADPATTADPPRVTGPEDGDGTLTPPGHDTDDGADTNDTNDGVDGVEVRVALGVLDIGDLLESYDIRLLLAEAVGALPGVDVLVPRTGEPYDRTRHRWEITEPAPDDRVVATVAYLISAGLANGDGLVLRPARVAVYDTEKD
jgi:hypothetical protein